MPPGRSYTTLFAVGLSLGANAACSSSTAPTVVPDAAVRCPATLEAALGATCAAEAQTCSFLYACGPFGQTATCACSGGRFSCTDAVGSPLDGGTAPHCVGPGDAGECPASETAADFAPCTETGLQCAYPSACASVPAYDSCQCVLDPDGGPTLDAGPSLHFECIQSCEFLTDASAATDALSAPDVVIGAPADAGSDATSGDARPDAPAAGDATTD
jgi:hypothetical protein